MTRQELYCATCAAVVLFEQPCCLDAHEDCPEWLCTRCGEATLVGPLTAVAGGRPPAPHGWPAQQRRAA